MYTYMHTKNPPRTNGYGFKTKNQLNKNKQTKKNLVNFMDSFSLWGYTEK